MTNRNQGFSLVELIVTMSIIGLIAAAGIVSYTTANRNARDAKRKSDLETVKAALEIYRTEEGCYPGSTTSPCTSADGANMTALLSELQSTNYLSNTNQIKDPRPSPYEQYVYTYGSANCSVYCMCAKPEAGGSPNSDTNNCAFDTSGDEDYYCICNP